jgi:hypothetical protein
MPWQATVELGVLMGTRELEEREGHHRKDFKISKTFFKKLKTAVLCFLLMHIFALEQEVGHLISTSA